MPTEDHNIKVADYERQIKKLHGLNSSLRTKYRKLEENFQKILSLNMKYQENFLNSKIGETTNSSTTQQIQLLSPERSGQSSTHNIQPSTPQIIQPSINYPDTFNHQELPSIFQLSYNDSQHDSQHPPSQFDPQPMTSLPQPDLNVDETKTVFQPLTEIFTDNNSKASLLKAPSINMK